MDPSPHDRFFRAVFERPEEAAGLLRAALPRRLRRRLDLESLSPRSGSVSDRWLSYRYTDLLFAAAAEPCEALVFVLIEHQSTADALMPLRVLAYMVRVWERWLKENRGATQVPPVVALVVSHSPGGWSAPRHLRQVVAGPPDLLRGLRRNLPDMELQVDDLARTSDRDLRRRPMGPLGRVALLMLKHARDGALPLKMRAWVDLLVEAWQTLGLAALEMVASYAVSVMNEEDADGFLDLMEDVGGRAAREMAMETEGYAVRRGKREGRVELLLSQLQQRFGDLSPEVAERLQGGSIEELDRWGTRLLSAATLAEVFDS